ncbi:MAG: type II toxin-antitoxin system HicA family toxin [Actinomycetota bacterium]
MRVRQRGSHVRVRCGRCQTTVPVHRGMICLPVCSERSSGTLSRASERGG